MKFALLKRVQQKGSRGFSSGLGACGFAVLLGVSGSRKDLQTKHSCKKGEKGRAKALSEGCLFGKMEIEPCRQDMHLSSRFNREGRDSRTRKRRSKERGLTGTEEPSSRSTSLPARQSFIDDGNGEGGRGTAQQGGIERHRTK